MNYEQLPSIDTINKTVEGLNERKITAIVVQNGAEALEKIKSMIPAGASIMNGSSTTLQEIGYIDYLKAGQHGWNNLHDAILAEKDQQKQSELRQKAVFADYFLVSVHAITEGGELVIASASGSQLPSIVFTSQNVIFVASANKIMPKLDDAIRRIRDYVFQLEDARMKSVGAPGSVLAKMLIFEREAGFSQRKINMILINEKHGF